MSQPEGFIDPDSPDDVYIHENGVYGFKQASRAWYKVLSEYLLKHKFVKGSIVSNFVHIKKRWQHHANPNLCRWYYFWIEKS